MQKLKRKALLCNMLLCFHVSCHTNYEVEGLRRKFCDVDGRRSQWDSGRLYPVLSTHFPTFGNGNTLFNLESAI